MDRITHVESGYPYPVIRELMSRGHSVRFDLGVYGGYQAIMRDERQGVYYGASESRKDGCAIGYQRKPKNPKRNVCKLRRSTPQLLTRAMVSQRAIPLRLKTIKQARMAYMPNRLKP